MTIRLGAVESSSAEYLSDSLSDRILTVTQGWGELGLNTAVRPAGQPGAKIRIKDREYAHGLGHHANGEIVVELNGQFKTFQTDVGIQRQDDRNVGSVIFQIFADGKKVFDSGIVRENDPPRTASIPVEGVSELRLIATDAGDGITCDCADWADARLIPDPAAVKNPVPPPVNIAPFARVVAWNPQAAGGTKASRVEEFPAEDIAPGKELLPGPDGSYSVPLSDGKGCIGLQWYENRLLRRLTLEFPGAVAVPPADSVQLQFWTGESAWQGQWQPAEITPEKKGNALEWKLGFQQLPRGTQKVRWIFSRDDQPLAIKDFSALTRSRWSTVGVRIESTHPDAPEKVGIDVYNGLLLDPPEGSPYHCTWDTSKPLSLKVRSSAAQPYKADRTVLRFRFPKTAFGVAVEDLQANDCVYVPDTGLFVTRQPPPVTLAEYLNKIAGKKTVMEEVHEKPDQDFPHAWSVVHNPVQDLGPTMLSLACDNRKFIVDREGAVSFNEYDRSDDPQYVLANQWSVMNPVPWRLVPHFGQGKNSSVSRHLEGGWLPIPVTSVTEGGVLYQQTSCVAPAGEAVDGKPAWLPDRAVCAVEYLVKNNGTEPADARLTLHLASQNKKSFTFKEIKNGMLAVGDGHVMLLIDTQGAAPLELKQEAGGVILSGKLPAGAAARCSVLIPAWKVEPTDYSALAENNSWLERAKDYWKKLFEPAMQIDVPDALLTNAIRASQVHCMLAARNEDAGSRIAPWIGSYYYGPLESESNAIIRGMDMTGHGDFARRCLDYFLKKCNAAGFITTGYTLVGTGEVLWTLGEHYQRTRDRAWMEKVAPETVRICRWVIRQRAKTKRLDARGEKVPEYGLMPPGVTADWNRFDYRFFNDAYYCAGLEATGRALADIGNPAALEILDDAKRYREDILRAYRWEQARMPVVPLQNGTWAPDAPSLLDCFGRIEDFLPAEDAGRTWCYCIEIGAHHLAANKILAPASKETDWLVDYLEDVQFLRDGWFDYPEAKNRQDVYCFGGFAKVQPYYSRIAEVHALRDDVKAFIRSYFNCIPSQLGCENLSFWEHFRNAGAWNKTHETGWFLCQTRTMFVTERGDDLWLAPFVTNHWMKNGMKVAVRNAPTEFGAVGYTITSAAADGHIDAVVQLPPQCPAQKIVLRLRHPEGKPIRSVTLDGKPYTNFDPKTETITWTPQEGTVTIRANY
ncbi:MAG: NPCBM/NEW2 domain-containing protein [Pirellulales bacterium]|nr:NPCBM/NEW2 domain-containing protein [Pirellulales bacterium]